MSMATDSVACRIRRRGGHDENRKRHCAPNKSLCHLTRLSPSSSDGIFILSRARTQHFNLPRRDIFARKRIVSARFP